VGNSRIYVRETAGRFQKQPLIFSPVYDGSVSARDDITANVQRYVSGSSGMQPFPHFGVITNSGPQVPVAAEGHAETYYDALLARYPWVMLGASNLNQAMPRPRKTINDSIRSFVVPGTRTAVMPLIGMYVIFTETSTDPNSGWAAYPGFVNACNAAGWWAKKVDGTLVPCAYNASLALCNMTHVMPKYQGMYPYEWVGNYAAQVFIDGTVAGPGRNDPNMDFLWFDNTGCRVNASVGGNWLLDGVNRTQTDPLLVAAATVGMKDISIKLRQLKPNLIVCANSNYAYDMDLGLNGSNIFQMFDFPNEENIWCEAGGASMQEWAKVNGTSYAKVKSYIQLLESSSRNGLSSVMGWFRSLAQDEVAMRWGLAMMTVFSNSYFISSFYQGSESVQPNQESTYPYCDEFWGGAKNLGGWLGNPLAGPTGSAYSIGNGLYRRDFDGGIVVVNSSASVSASTSLSGPQFYRLRTVNGQTVNNAAAVYNVSVPGNDAVFLSRSPT
jgi:hypothetical protein